MRVNELRLNSIDPLSNFGQLFRLSPDMGIEVLIASTPETISLLNNPEIRGLEFQNKLSEALKNIAAAIYQSLDCKAGQSMRSNPIDVLYILRGGLNFNFHNFLAEVSTKFPEVSFISSQRIPDDNGFIVGEASYQKWSIQDNALLCLGDISATGTTLKYALERIVNQYASEGKKPCRLLIFTVGTSRAFKELKSYIGTLNEAWDPIFEGVTVVFLEAIFSLYEGNTDLAATHLPYTDFFRKSFPRSLQFEADCVSKPVTFLERCAIYDGGSRSFEPNTYLKNLKKYWTRLKEQSDTQSIVNLLHLKSDFMDYQLDFDTWLDKRKWWTEFQVEQLKSLHLEGQKVLNEFTKKSLVEIAQGRLDLINMEEMNVKGN